MFSATGAVRRPIFRGTLIANVNMTAEQGNRLIADGLADMVAFGLPYISQWTSRPLRANETSGPAPGGPAGRAVADPATQ
jgi:hypothetical protein